MICPMSCSMILRRSSSNRPARSALVLFAICLSWPTVLPKQWSEGSLIGSLSKSPTGAGYPEQNIPNLNFGDPQVFCCCLHSKAAIDAPWEKPRMPSKLPS